MIYERSFFSVIRSGYLAETEYSTKCTQNKLENVEIF